MQWEEIDRAISDIMQIDGPDGHTDGSNVITDFVVLLLEDSQKAGKWISDYRSKHFSSATEE